MRSSSNGTAANAVKPQIVTDAGSWNCLQFSTLGIELAVKGKLGTWADRFFGSKALSDEIHDFDLSQEDPVPEWPGGCGTSGVIMVWGGYCNFVWRWSLPNDSHGRVAAKGREWRLMLSMLRKAISSWDVESQP